MAKRKRKAKGFWKRPQNILKETEKVMRRYGRSTVPTFDQLRERGYSSLAVAISTNYPGGYRGLRRFVEGAERMPNGYWQKWENFDRELDDAIGEIGHYPTQTELEYSGRTAIVSSAQRHYGGLNSVRESRNVELLRRDNKFWHEWGNVERVLKKVIEEIGHFPSSTELSDAGEISATIGIKNFGGVAKVKERLGYSTEGDAKTPNYWKLWKNVREGIEGMFAENEELNGKIPTSDWMRDNGYGDLLDSMFRHHRGINAVRKKLGQDRNTHNDGIYRTKAGIWRGLEGLWKDHPDKRGTLPPDNWLRSHGYTTISSSVGKHHGGFVKARKSLGLGSSGKKRHKYERGSLKSWKKFRKAVGEMLAEHPELNGTYPAQKWLRNNGYTGLIHAAGEYHGGSIAARKKLGHTRTRREAGKLADFDYVVGELKRIIAENSELEGKCPDSRWLCDHGHGGLYAGIGKHHGGIGTFIDHFGGDSSRNPDGHWKDMDNVRAEFRMILEKHPELDGRVPSSHWLQTRGYSYLAAGIYHSQGSFGEVRKQLILEFGSGNRQRKELEALLTDYVEGGNE